MYRREAARLFKNLDGIRSMDKYPAAMFIVDIKREHNAVAEGAASRSRSSHWWTPTATQLSSLIPSPATTTLSVPSA